jgi:hypothetical protein
MAQICGNISDARLSAFSQHISNPILTYTKNYKLNRINKIAFERGYEIAYLKSPTPPQPPSNPK